MVRIFSFFPKSKTGCFFLSCVFFCLSVRAETACSLTSLSVSENAGISRLAAPVTSGIPLPKDAKVLSIENLAVTDSKGATVPAQFAVLSRWNGTPDDTAKPIKWVLIDFQTDISANSTNPYYLKNVSAGKTHSSGLSLQNGSDRITVSTGKARFQISKNRFNLFDSVWTDRDGDGQMDDEIVSQPGKGGIILTDKSGKQFTALLEKPEEIIVEEQGPLRAVIKIRGTLKSADGSRFAPSVHQSGFDQPYKNSFFYYNCRMHFFDNTDYVKIFFTIENNGSNGRTNPEQNFAPAQAVYFDSLRLVLKTDTGAGTDVRSEDAAAQLNASDVFTLYQDWHENLTDSYADTLEPKFSDGIFYVSKKNSEILSEGRANPGWVEVRGKNGGIGFAMRHFWQNFPKKITVSSEEIAIGLWPEEGYYPYCSSADFSDSQYDMYCREAGKEAGVYLFDAGRHKTYEMVFRFYSGNDDTKTKQMSQSLESPLMALAPSEWYAQTGALGMISPANLSSQNREINEAMQRFEKHHRAMVYAEDSENGMTLINLKTAKSPYWEFSKQNRFFNWMNFGDLLWAGQSPCALHYDWPCSMLLHYLRTGKRMFFDAGTEMVRHRYDIDQYHGERSGNYKWISHMAFYESSGHADPSLHSHTPSRVSLHSHTWNGGPVLYYLLTGDRKAWEAAEENGKAALNHYGTGGLFDADVKKPAQYETRMETWPILNLIHLYRVSGNAEYLRVAKNIAKNRLLVREQAAGGKGYFGSGDENSVSDASQSTVMWMYAVEAMIHIHYETQDPELRQLLIRMADFTKDSFLFGGVCNDKGEYMPVLSTWIWHKNDPDGSAGLAALNPNASDFYTKKEYYSAEPVNTFFWADLFAYAYRLTDKTEYLDWARKCFRDSIFYYDKEGKTYGTDGYINPASRALLSFIDGKYPESRTKIHGWIARSSQIYLFTEWQIQQGPLTIQFKDRSLDDGKMQQ